MRRSAVRSRSAPPPQALDETLVSVRGMLLNISRKSLLLQLCHSKRFRMATFRKRKGKWQAQVRRLGVCSVSKSFHELNDAKVWPGRLRFKLTVKSYRPT